MSDKFVFELVLNVDGTTANAGVKKLVRSLQAELNKKFTIDIDFPTSKSVSNRLTRLTRRLQEFNHELNTLSRLAPVASHAISTLNASTSVSVQTFKDLRISSAQANKVLQGNASIVNAGATAMERLGSQTALTTRRYAAFIVASRAFFGLERAIEESIGKAIDFNTEITRISQILDLPVNAIQGLKNEIRDLSTSFGTPANELAGVANTLAQAGFSISETQKLLNNIAPTTLAPTFGQVNDTVDGLIAILAQFNIEASKSGEILDTLNELAAQFPAEVGDLFEIIKRAGATFSAASGVREGTTDAIEAFKELAAIGTAVRSTTRLNASQIGTSLRTIFGRLQGSDVIDDLQRLGINLVDVEGKFVGPINALEILNEKLKNISTQSTVFTDIATTIGGLRQLDKTIILLSDLEGILSALDVATSVNVGGSVFRDVNAALGDTGIQLRQLRESFDEFVGAIVSSNSFQSTVQGLIAGGQLLLEGAQKLAPIAPILATILGGKAISGGFSFIKGFVDNIRYMNVNTEAINRNTTAILTLNRSFGLTSPAVIPHFGQQKRRTRGFASGGMVRGPGGSKEDNLLTAVSNGEYIIQADAVKKFGISFLNSINRGDIPGFARGGSRKKLPGGGTTAGSLEGVITGVLEDARRKKFINESRTGAEAFSINPDAIEFIIISQLKKGIDPRVIRSKLLEIFNSIRIFIDSRIESSKIPLGRNISSTPSNLLVPSSGISFSRSLPILNRNVNIPNPSLRGRMSSQLALPAPERLLGLPAPNARDIRRQRILNRREFNRTINNPPIIMGNAPSFLGPERPDFNFFESDQLRRRRRITERLINRGNSPQRAAQLADISVNRNRAFSRRSSILGRTKFAFGGFDQNKINGALLAAGIGSTLIPTSPGGPGEKIQSVVGSALSGAGVGGFLGPVGAIIGGLGGIVLGTSSALKAWQDELTTEEIKNFRRELSNATTEVDKSRITNKIISSLSKRLEKSENLNKNLDKLSNNAGRIGSLAGPLGIPAFIGSKASKFILRDNTQTKAQELFTEGQEEIDSFSKSLAQRTFKNRSRSVADFISKSSGDRDTVEKINKLSRISGSNFNIRAQAEKEFKILRDEFNKKQTFELISLQKLLADSLVGVLNTSFADLSKSIEIASFSLDKFSEETNKIIQEGTGNFAAQFRNISVGAGTSREIRSAIPTFTNNSSIDELLEFRDNIQSNLSNILLNSATNKGSNSLSRQIDLITANKTLPSILTNQLKRAKERKILDLDDSAPESEKFQAFQEVLTDFVNSPTFTAAQQSIEQYVSLLNKQNSALQENIAGYLKLINVQRESINDANQISRGGRDLRRRFTERFTDTRANIGIAAADTAETLKTLFPSLRNTNPRGIGASIQEERNRLRILEESPRSETNIKSIQETNDRINQLVEALKFLKESTDELTAIENRLVSISQGRENTVNFAKRLATASPEESADINRQIFNLRRFEAGGNLNSNETGGVLDFVDQLLTLPEEILTKFGRSKADLQALQEKIISDRFGATVIGGEAIKEGFANAPGGAKEELALLNRIDAINKTRADAAKQIGELANKRIEDINKLINKQIDVFNKGLESITSQALNIDKISKIADKLAAIPASIQFEGNVKVEVNLNNGQILDKLDPFIRNIITTEIDKQLNLNKRREQDVINGE